MLRFRNGSLVLRKKVRPLVQVIGLLVLFERPSAAQVFPDPKLTPGRIDPHCTVKMICTKGYTATVRHVTAATKEKIVRQYLASHPEWPKCNPIGKEPCEIDHFISLELCGLNDNENLWPEPYNGDLGARQKDVVETGLHRQICKGQISLRDAQKIIATNWPSCYRALKAGKKCSVAKPAVEGSNVGDSVH